MKIKALILLSFPNPNPRRSDGFWPASELSGKTLPELWKITGRINKHISYWESKGINVKKRRHNAK